MTEEQKAALRQLVIAGDLMSCMLVTPAPAHITPEIAVATWRRANEKMMESLK